MNLTNKFPLEKIKDILLIPLKDLNNLELLKETLSKDVSEEYGDFTFSAAGEGGIQIQLFNDPDDDNNDAVATELEIDKEINNGFAFMSYEVFGKVKGGLKGDLDYLALGLSKVNEIAHKSYMKHSNTITLAQAIAKDVLKFKVAFDWDSIANLEDYETVSMWSKGALELDAEISVSDTFTPLISGISKLLNTTGGIGVKLDMSASLKVSINIADFFQTIIQRRDKNGRKSYNVTIRKDSKNTKQTSAAFGVAAAISNPEVLMDAINKIIDKGEKGVGSELEKLKGKVWSKLSAKEQGLVETASLAIGLDPKKHADKLLEKYTEKRDSIVAKIKALVESEVKFSVSYTYERTRETQALLKGTFTESGLQACFKNILKLKVKEVYSYTKDNPKEVKVSDYLDLTKISIVKATKIGFSISEFELAQLVKKTLDFEDQVLMDSNNPEEVQSVSFSSGKFTAEKFGVFKERENSIILSGSYSGAPKPDVFMTNLDYELTLHWAETYKNLKDANLRKIVDFAATWDIIEEKSFEEQLSSISKMLKGQKKIKVAAYLKMKEGSFDRIIDPIINLSDYSFQQALAASVPYADYDGRQSPSSRKDLYYSFFNFYLKQESGDTVDYEKVKQMIVRHLETNNKPKLARFEEYGDNNKYTPLDKLLEFNFMAFRFNRFKTAISLLNDSKKNFQSIIRSAEFLRNLNSVRLQPEFNMRFLGRLILDLSREKGIDEVLERSLTIEYKDDKGKENKYVLAR